VSELLVVPPRTAEVVGDSPERRVEILSDDDALAVTWSRFGPHRDGADLHVHRHHSDLFYVLAGELTLRLGLEDDALPLPVAGTLVCVPPLVVHGFRNASDADVVFLNLHAPGMQFAEYLRALRDGVDFSYDQHEPPPDGGRPTTEIRPTAGDGVLVATDEIAIACLRLAPGAALPSARRFLFVLAGAVEVGEATAAEGTWAGLPEVVPVTALEDGAAVLDIRAPGSSNGPR
jgi:mannose-6-phosphate isomerase-like protein (cupin superfamily)